MRILPTKLSKILPPLILALLLASGWYFSLPVAYFMILAGLALMLWTVDRFSSTHKTTAKSTSQDIDTLSGRLTGLQFATNKISQLIDEIIRPEFSHITEENDKLRYVVNQSVKDLFSVFKTMSSHLQGQQNFVKKIIQDMNLSYGDCNEQIRGLQKFTYATEDILGELVSLVIQTSQQNMDIVYQFEDITAQIQAASTTLEHVQKVSDRTNLLAFNAAIEAARSGGEHGKLFARMAEEVRQLAHDTAHLSQSARDEILDASQKIFRARDIMQEIAARDMKSSLLAKDKIGKLIQQIIELDKRFDANIGSLAGMENNLSQTMNKAVIALQFEDIANQVSTHIENRMQWLNRCVDGVSESLLNSYDQQVLFQNVVLRVDQLLDDRKKDKLAGNSPVKKKDDGGTIDFL